MNDDLKAVNYFKEFETKHKELKDEFRRVYNDILFLISRLEKLNSELRRLPEKVEQDNSEIFQSFNEVIEKRNEKITPIVHDLEDAVELRQLNVIIQKQGWTIQDFIKELDIAPRTFYKKVETHTFTMKELNIVRRVLSLTDQEFLTLFFN